MLLKDAISIPNDQNSPQYTTRQTLNFPKESPHTSPTPNAVQFRAMSRYSRQGHLSVRASILPPLPQHATMTISLHPKANKSKPENSSNHSVPVSHASRASSYPALTKSLSRLPRKPNNAPASLSIGSGTSITHVPSYEPHRARPGVPYPARSSAGLAGADGSSPCISRLIFKKHGRDISAACFLSRSLGFFATCY